MEANRKLLNYGCCITIEMMEAGAHFGHQTRRWNPKMLNIFIVREMEFTIDLVKTAYV